MDTETSEITCPQCQKKDLVFKVRQIYSESLSIMNKKESHPALETIMKNKGDVVPLPSPYGNDFTHLFAPPSGKNDMVRLFHPDLIAAVFGGICLYFMYISYSVQPVMFYILAAALAGLAVFYAFNRKKAMSQYNENILEDQTVLSDERMLEYWGKLYYCARDGTVFEAGQTQGIPLNEMKIFIRKGGKLE